MDYWGQPASPEEQLTPGFPETAASLYAVAEQERQKLSASDAEFNQIRDTVFHEGEVTRKAVRSRVDRDLDFLVEGYVGKLELLRILRNPNKVPNPPDLPVLTRQIDQCHAELERLFTTYPMPRPAIGSPLSPCLARVPRTK